MVNVSQKGCFNASSSSDCPQVPFPQEHWRKVWRTNPLERLNVAQRGAYSRAAIKRNTNMVGIFPNDGAIIRLVGSQLLEQQEELQLERRRLLSESKRPKFLIPKTLWSSPTVTRPRRWYQPSAEPHQLLF